VRCVYFYCPARLYGAQIEGDITCTYPELEKIRLVVLEAKLAVRPSTYECLRADLDLKVTVTPSVQKITRGKRSVDLRLRPILSPRTPERNLTRR
jgi:hypothetical protein